MSTRGREFDSIPGDNVVHPITNPTNSNVNAIDSSAPVSVSNDSVPNGPEAGLFNFFAHRIRDRGDTFVVDADPRVTVSESRTDTKRGRENISQSTDTIVCNGAAAVPVKQEIDSTGGEVHVNKRTKTGKDESHLDGTVRNDKQLLPETLERFNSYRLKSDQVAVASEDYVTSLHAALDSSFDQYKEILTAYRVKHERIIDIQKDLINDWKGRATKLKEDVKSLEAELKEKDKILFDTTEDNEDKMYGIRECVNELRYVTEFGESYSRGVAICPVTRNQLMPKESVLMMIADCDCNCMITYDAAGPLIKKFMDGTHLQCMTCRADVTSIKATTMENAETLFAWRNVQIATECHCLNDVYAARLAKVEKDKADQTRQDTLALRIQLGLVSDDPISAGI